VFESLERPRGHPASTVATRTVDAAAVVVVVDVVVART
jgi:hypothetical protein